MLLFEEDVLETIGVAIATDVCVVAGVSGGFSLFSVGGEGENGVDSVDKKLVSSLVGVSGDSGTVGSVDVKLLFSLFVVFGAVTGCNSTSAPRSGEARGGAIDSEKGNSFEKWTAF